MTSLLRDQDDYIERFAGFVGESPSSYHAVQTIAALLVAAGFTEWDETEQWEPIMAGSSGFVRRDGALIAWKAGDRITATSPVRVLGSHTDSPGLVLKPKPDFSREGWAQAGVEIYGGPLLTTWFDRDLALAGRIVTAEGTEHLVRTPAVARVPMLAIHLDREAGSLLSIDKQRHLQPIIGTEHTSALGLLAEAAGVASEAIAGTDVRFADTQPPARIGAHSELFASPRLDNLSSVFAGVAAILESEAAAGSIAMLAAFDHEELGSESRSGARGPLLAEVIGRLREGLGASADEAAQAMASSWCMSADAGHAVHPNYVEKHDPNVHPLAGGGPMLKVNANQRYASDAHGAAMWRRCYEETGVAAQVFVSNNTVPCGSTIGPLTAARLGMRTFDVGVPLLSMHSARELAHVDDLFGLARITTSFFNGA